MSRYRITIEIDAEGPRMAVNRLSMEMKDLAVQKWCNPVYVATELVTPSSMELYNRKEKISG